MRWLPLAGLLLGFAPPAPEYRPLEKQARVVEQSAARLAALAQRSAASGRPLALTPLQTEARQLAQELDRLEERLGELGR